MKVQPTALAFAVGDHQHDHVAFLVDEGARHLLIVDFGLESVGRRPDGLQAGNGRPTAEGMRNMGVDVERLMRARHRTVRRQRIGQKRRRQHADAGQYHIDRTRHVRSRSQCRTTPQRVMYILSLVAQWDGSISKLRVAFGQITAVGALWGETFKDLSPSAF